MWSRELIKNKVLSIGLILVGIISVMIETDGVRDGTVLIFTLMIGIPWFFAKENWCT